MCNFLQARHRLSATALIALLCLAKACPASVLDWNVKSWAAGSNSQSYDVDPTFTGNDISLVFSGDVNKFRNDPTTGQATPVTNQVITGGLTPVQTSLNLGVDFHQNNTITLTVTLATPYVPGATGVSFAIFGIDKNGTTYQDQIASISALSSDGITLIAPTITGVGSAVTLAGTGLNQTLTGNALVPQSGTGSEAGNATISFGNAVIRSFTITYQDGIGSKPNPTFQNLSISNIYFSPVPEVNAGTIVVAICVAAVGVAQLRRVRRLTRRVACR